MNQMLSMSEEAEDLVRAFDNGDLCLHYQPQVDVGPPWPVIVGHEALLRWQLPDGRFARPDRIIPTAEACGLVTALDVWVIGMVCEEMAWTQATGGGHCPRMSANVSTQQFGRTDFAPVVADILSRTGITPACLTLEITERAVLEQDETTLGNIHALREMGVALALDDFGTGYSSLFHLRGLPIQEIKLDRSFVSGIPDRHRDAAIVSATIDLAAELNLRVVAEGVELACQAEWLRMKGCTLIQGFLYGRPTARLREAVA